MSTVTRNDWHWLRQYTTARIGGGRAGNALPTAEQLQFQLDHARARDAVHLPLDAAALARGLEAFDLPCLRVRSQAVDRRDYLQRPDRGRRLRNEDRRQLEASRDLYDVVLIVADGLSAAAVHTHAQPCLRALVPALQDEGVTLAPLVVVEQGRVAIGDDIGEALGARLSLLLIGERPGLSSPDSLGLYLTFGPRPGRTDAQRNCISNIRPPQGLAYLDATRTCLYLCRTALRRELSGVALKDESLTLAQAGSERIPFFRDGGPFAEPP
jgi:ethanolamine ammonia-lyase small subunit